VSKANPSFREILYVFDEEECILTRLKSLFLLCGFWLIAQAAPAGSAPKLNVTQTKLANGLTVLALEDHTVPTVAVHILFKVGSRNERPVSQGCRICSST
jgi:hypothetical protein